MPRLDPHALVDIVDGIVRSWENASGYRIYNLGGSGTVTLTETIRTIERALGKSAEIRYLPVEAGDVPNTFADVTLAKRELGFEPRVPIDDGVRRFVEWYTAMRERTEASSGAP